jgi:hypothetical protein
MNDIERATIKEIVYHWAPTDDLPMPTIEQTRDALRLYGRVLMENINFFGDNALGVGLRLCEAYRRKIARLRAYLAFLEGGVYSPEF